jgi:hypothetical protein
VICHERGMRLCEAGFQEGPPLAGRKTAVKHDRRDLQNGPGVVLMSGRLRGAVMPSAPPEEGAVLVARAGRSGDGGFF